MNGQNDNSTGNDQSDNSYLAMVGDIQAELTRLQVQHRWIQMCLKNKIVFAPIDLTKDRLKILDMGCADGTLLRDLQKQVPPSAQMVGADVSTAFMPTSAQGNIRYVTQNVCDPPAAELKGQFDMTHVRNVLHSTQKCGIEQAVANLSDTLAPGGWLQVMEMDMTSGQLKQPQALQDLIQVIGYMFEKQGMDRHYARKIPDSMKKAGLENVTVKTVECGIGKVLGDEAAVKSSIEPFMHTIPLVARNAKLMCPDLDPKIHTDLEDRYTKEMIEQGGYFPGKIYYAQKPPV
ncbi:methyltransferase domain-containing protein [Colletotrichum incanum]|uniref:Methyltransferase domain-containing protein n=1 Tax=Colletotrichum incanum TaxID=1573173 RepID=A0A166RPY7_COLIC|nr:methyltransferase domain-containing protein [Colletotrichum incanum]